MAYLYADKKLITTIHNLASGDEISMADTFYSFTLQSVFYNYEIYKSNLFLSNDSKNAHQLYIYFALKDDPTAQPSDMTMFRGVTFARCGNDGRRLSITTHSRAVEVPLEDLKARMKLMKQESKLITSRFNEARQLDPDNCYYFGNKYSPKLMQYGCTKEDANQFSDEVWSACAHNAFGTILNLFPIMPTDGDGKPVPTSTIMSDKGDRILKAISDSYDNIDFEEFYYIDINGKSLYKV